MTADATRICVHDKCKRLRDGVMTVQYTEGGPEMPAPLSRNRYRDCVGQRNSVQASEVADENRPNSIYPA